MSVFMGLGRSDNDRNGVLRLVTVI